MGSFSTVMVSELAQEDDFVEEKLSSRSMH